jgi:hypothetical protein
VPQNIKVAVVRSDLVEGLLGAVPLIENFLDHISMVAKLKLHRPLVRLPAGIALYLEDHPNRPHPIFSPPLFILAFIMHSADRSARGIVRRIEFLENAVHGRGANGLADRSAV